MERGRSAKLLGPSGATAFNGRRASDGAISITSGRSSGSKAGSESSHKAKGSSGSSHRSRSQDSDRDEKSSSSSKQGRAKSDEKRGFFGSRDKKAAGSARFADKAKADAAAVTGPRLADAAPGEEQQALLRQKLQDCCIMYSFKTEDKLAEKERKRQILLEIMEYASSIKKLGEDALRDILEMVGNNLFRTLSKRERTPLDILDAEDDEPALDPAWPHLEVAYEILLRIVSSKDIDGKYLERLIDHDFVTSLLDLFDSDDPRERENLKGISKMLFSKCSGLRAPIRKAIQHTCLKASYEGELLNGMGERLEILMQAISKFSTPLKDDNKDLLLRVLLPLHKVASLGMFHSQLVDCVKCFMSKDPLLGYEVAICLLRSWPVSSGSKQILFLSELEDLVASMPSSEFARLRARFAKCLGHCLCCPNSDVAERALGLMRNDKLIKLITRHCKDHFTSIVSALYKNCTQAWSRPVAIKTFDTLKVLLETDSDLFDTSSAKYRKDAEEAELMQAERERKWAILEEMHRREQAKLAARAASAELGDKAVNQKVSESKSKLSKKGSLELKELPGSRADTVAATLGISTKYSAGDSGDISPGILSDIGAKGPAKKPVLKRKESANSLTSTTNSGRNSSGGTGEYSSKDVLALYSDRYGISVSWEPDPTGANSAAELCLQALAVDGRGRIVEAVHDGNPSVPSRAMKFCSRAGASAFASTLPGGMTRSESNRSSDGTYDGGRGGVIWVVFTKLPKRVQLVIFCVVARAGTQRLCDASDAAVHIVEAAQGLEMAQGTEVASYTFSDATTGVGTVALARRGAGRGSLREFQEWYLQRAEDFSKPGQHYMDIQESTISRLIRDMIPGLPRRHRAMTQVRSMDRGVVVDLPCPPACKSLLLGVGWDLAAAATDYVSVRVSAVFLDADGRTLGAACREKPEDCGARHGGTGGLGEGFRLELAALPATAVQIFIIGNLNRSDTYFELIQQPHCAVVEPGGCELCRFTAPPEYRRETGLIIARLFRDPSSRFRWCFQAVGSFCQGRSWKESLPEISELFWKEPWELMVSPDDDSIQLDSTTSSKKKTLISL